MCGDQSFERPGVVGDLACLFQKPQLNPVILLQQVKRGRYCTRMLKINTLDIYVLQGICRAANFSHTGRIYAY
jgi:hypothetical protein